MEHSILTIVVAFVIAAMSGMGIGSAGLFVLYLTSVVHCTQMEAQGLNLIFFFIASAASMLIHARQRTLPLEMILILSITGMATAVVGSRLASVLPEIWLRRLFGAMMCASGAIALFRSSGKSRKKDGKTA